MTWLKLTPGFKIKVGLSFEHPSDDDIRMAAAPELQAEAMSGLLAHERSPEAVDAVMGLKTWPMATLTVLAKHSIADSRPLFLTREELHRHIHECKAALNAMDAFAEKVDEHMARYRRNLQQKENE